MSPPPTRDAAALHSALPAELLLQAIVDSTDDAIYSQSLDGIVTSWNGGAEHLFGYSAAEAVGMAIRRLVPGELRPEESDLVERLRDRERIQHYESVRLRKDGRAVPVSLSLSALRDGNGDLLGAAVIARDISAQRESSAATALLAAIVQSSDDAIVSKDLRGIVTSWNESAQRVFGYTAEEMVGQPIWKVFPPDRLDEEPMILARLERGERVDHFQTVRVRKNGEHFPVSLTISPIRDASGKVVGASKIARDITREVKAIEQLAVANEELKRADRMKSEFLAIMSHELRTPLNSILGFASVLRQGRSGPVTEEQRAQLELIRRSGKHLLNLINDVLDLSRIEAGRMEVEIEEIAVGDLIAEVVQTLELQAKQKNLVVHVDLRCRPLVFSDRKRLFQVLLNLVQNAIKFTTQGTVSISVEQTAEQVSIAVADTGIGIAAEKLGSLFAAFSQIEASPRRRFEGTGLGLYLSKRLMQLLGGRIEVASEPNRGSTFTVFVPAGREGGAATQTNPREISVA